jgi:hypothetical protein
MINQLWFFSVIRFVLLLFSFIIGFFVAAHIFIFACFFIGYCIGYIIDRLFYPGFLEGFLIAGWIFCLLPVLIGSVWGGWFSFKLTKRWLSKKL